MKKVIASMQRAVNMAISTGRAGRLVCSWGTTVFLASSQPLAARLVPTFSLDGCASKLAFLDGDLRGGGDAARDGRTAALSTTGDMVQRRDCGRGEARAE